MPTTHAANGDFSVRNVLANNVEIVCFNSTIVKEISQEK